MYVMILCISECNTDDVYILKNAFCLVTVIALISPFLVGRTMALAMAMAEDMSLCLDNESFNPV